MSKRLKLRISRVMTSLQTCRSKDPSTLPSDPVPSFLRLSFPTHHRSSSSSVFNRKYSPAAHPYTGLPSPEFKWRKEDKWHVVAKAHNDDAPRQKIYNSTASCQYSSDDLFFPPPGRKKLRTKKKKKTAAGGGGGVGVRLQLSTTCSASLFSSEGEAEEEWKALVSTSRSFSTSTTDSSLASTTRRRPIKTNKKKNKEEEIVPARVSWVLKRMMIVPCGGEGMVVEGKVRESYAVVKRSEDPKEDFKRSMLEMVVEKEMFEEAELEQLLLCFLSLNSRSHQGVIVQAFTEIWEALFSSTTTSSSFPPLPSTKTRN